MWKIAVYPGSFDPLTLGHVDVARRAAGMFDEMIIAVLDNPSKTALFTPDERVKLIEESFRGNAGVSVRKFSGLLVDFMAQIGARVVIRGLRFVSDFEYELQMALTNQSLRSDIETVFLVAHPGRTFISSTLVREIGRLGRDVSAYVPEPVAAAMKAKYS